MLTRALITLGLIILGLCLYHAWNYAQMRRLRRSSLEATPGLEGLQSGIPAILYFTIPDCAPCRSIQWPAIEQVQTELAGRVQVLEIDANARPAVAAHWGVLSVPTTFVLDAAGHPRRVNHGVTSAIKLKRQLERISPVTKFFEKDQRIL
jgi:thioredoxin 1